MLAAILPGIQITYMGEEIGMEDGQVACQEGYDPQAIKNCDTYDQKTRDYQRTPFHWDNSTNAGFNNGAKTWLPVSEKYIVNNLAAQNVKGLHSHYNIYKDLIKLRKDFRNTTSDRLELKLISENVVKIIRQTESVKYVLLWNVGNSTEHVNLNDEETLLVAVPSSNSNFTVNEHFVSQNVLSSFESVLLKARL